MLIQKQRLVSCIYFSITIITGFQANPNVLCESLKTVTLLLKITRYLLQLIIYYYIALRWVSMWITELNVLFIWKQNDMEELDDILTAVFKQEIPYYKFQSLQTEIYPQKECEYFTIASVIL